jgi:hypothetical protein
LPFIHLQHSYRRLNGFAGKKLISQESEYLLVSPVEDQDLLVGVVVDPRSMLGSSARSGYDILKACVCLHTIKAYVPCAQHQTKTMIEGLDFYDLLTDPMDLLSASQIPANPTKIFK